MMMELIVNYLPLFGVLALAFVFFKNKWVSKQDEGNIKMVQIARHIADGSMSFLKAEYKLLSVFVLAVAILLFFKGSAEYGEEGGIHISHWMVGISFVLR